MHKILSWITNHKKIVSVIAALIFVFAGVAVFTLTDPGWGDAGGFSGSHSYGGGGGGSSYSGGGSSSYGGSSHYYYGGSSSDDDSDPMLTIIVVAIIVIIVIINMIRNKNSGGSMSNGPQPEGAKETPASMLRPITELQAKDSQFSQAAVEQTIANVYVQMQQNWTRKDFEPMRPYFSNELFSQFSNQLAQMKNMGQTNYVNNIAVLEVSTRGWYESKGNEYLVMKVRTRITDFTVDDRTGNVISGFKDAESFMTYEYTLSRTAGTKTGVMNKQTVAGQCPHCGAPINLAQSAKCEYCGTVIESKQHTWVITEIRGISQQIMR